MNKLKYLIILLPVILSACPTPENVNHGNIGINNTSSNAVLSITVKDGISGQNIPNAKAKIILSDGTILEKSSDNNGKVVFDGLEDGNNYNVEVSSENYLTNSMSTLNSNIAISKNKLAYMELKLYKTNGSFSGTLVSPDNTPISSAIIQVGNDIGLSDEAGNFKINITNLTQQKITISKISYNNFDYGSFDFSLNSKDKSAGIIKLTPSNKQINVIFDSSKLPFGITNLDPYKDCISYLQEIGYKTSYENFLQFPNPDQVDILVLASPSQAYSNTEINQIKNFARKGKKIIILGEWGGYSYFNSESVNKILLEANLKINQDIVKNKIATTTYDDNDEILSVDFNTHPIMKDISSINLYGTSSLDIVNGGVSKINSDITKILAYSSKTGFTIQNTANGSIGLLAVSNIGLGKVVLLGDSSLFMSLDSNKNKILNINEKDNRSLLKNIFAW